MRIIVTGARDHDDEHAVYNALDAHWRNHPAGQPFVVVHGACPTGADDHARHWAASRGVPQEPYPARDFGPWPWCGPRRNTHMVRLGGDLVIAFPGPKSRGTWDCVRKARAAGIPVEIHPWQPEPEEEDRPPRRTQSTRRTP